MCKLTFLFWWSHWLKKKINSVGPYLISTSTKHYSWNIYNFMTCMVYHFKPHIWRKETSCQIKSDNQFLQCGFHASIIPSVRCRISPCSYWLTNQKNAWLLRINMETHLFKEKRRETFHLINSKRWSYCFMNFHGEILHWCIIVFKINTGNTWHK